MVIKKALSFSGLKENFSGRRFGNNTRKRGKVSLYLIQITKTKELVTYIRGSDGFPNGINSSFESG